MKKFSLLALLFFFFLGNAQKPISESNSFMYNKQNYGYELLNCYTNFYQEENGKIVVWPDQKPYIEIGSITAKQYLKNSKITESLEAIIKLNGKTFLFNNTANIFEVFTKRKSRKISFSGVKSIRNPILFKNKIWFIDYDKEKKVDFFYTFDGKKNQLINYFANLENTYNLKLHIIKNELYFVKRNPISNVTQLYTVRENRINLVKTYPFNCSAIYFTNKEDVLFNYFPISNKIYRYCNGKISLYYDVPFENGSTGVFKQFSCAKQDNFMNILSFSKAKPEIKASISNVPLLANTLYSKETNSYYLCTGNNFYRLFPYIKKYARVFDNVNSQQIFSISQAKDGKIWAGSYNGKLAFLDKDHITQSPLNYSFMNFGMRIHNKMLLNTEFKKGILLFDDETHYKRIVEDAESFTNFISKDSIFYVSDAIKGIIYAPWKEVLKGNTHWQRVSKKQGLDWTAVDDFAEDQYGNIWGAKNKKGLFVYQPKEHKVTVFDADKKQFDGGSVALLVDDKRTLWGATNSGKLYYYSSKNKDDLSPKNFHQIFHPLLQSGKTISFIHQWKNYLVLGASDKILLFDLDKFYRERKISVRYLNAMETNFTTNTEQHAVLTDFRDQSIWFTTSDMLYQWNINDWLKLPTFKVTPKILIKKDTLQLISSENQLVTFKPRENSFDIQIDYQTKDNMPRYLNAILVKENEKPIFDNPNLETFFHFSNLSSGKYIFYVRVCQQDGSFTVHKFPIEVDKFFWQNWWFWFIISLFPIVVIFYYFKNKKQIEKHKKEIAQLNVNTLSNQFRPHFMLNALNSLGTELDDKPHAEAVISRIGENINLMYAYSQDKKFYIPFEKEWKLVENTIEIQKLIFIKKLEVKIENLNIIPKDYLLPMGILQVCVENALLHGIRHRKTPPFTLSIHFFDIENGYSIEIIDNGVGRKRSSEIYNFKRKGTGLNNVYSLLKIINNKIKNAISIEIKDTIFTEKDYPGTKVTIKLLKNINYEIFKL